MLLALTLAALAQTPPAAAPRNVVLLVADDLGWGDVGWHANDVRTPTLDRLCAEGVELDRFYVTPQCTPTRVALLTGRHPSRWAPHVTSASNERALPPGTPTLATLMQRAGLATALTGKWHLGSKPEWGPNHYGFDHSHGSLAGAVGMLDHRYRLNSPFTDTWHRNHELLEEEGHATDLVAAEAVRWIEAHADERFFLYVPFHAVHVPLVEEERWFEGLDHAEDRDRRLFLAAVAHLDDAVARIVLALERTGVAEDTLIVFFSDNGGLERHKGDTYPPPDPALRRGFSSNAPLRGWKTQGYEGGIRVPAFARWPKGFEARRIEAPLHAVDVLPTLAALLDAPLEGTGELDGVDVSPLFAGNVEESAPRTLYWNWGNGRWLVVRDGDLKLVRRRDKEDELYDLAADPFEATDLAAERPEDLERLRELLEVEREKDAR
jgi:arylsulfatase A-like enzyme